MFSSVSFKIKVNQPNMKLDGKNIIYVCRFFTVVTFLDFSKFCVYNIGYIKNAHNSLKNRIILKKPIYKHR